MGDLDFLCLARVHSIGCDRDNWWHFGRALVHLTSRDPKLFNQASKSQPIHHHGLGRFNNSYCLSFDFTRFIMDRRCGRERPLSQSPLYCFICFPTLSLPFCVALVPNHRVQLPVWPTLNRSRRWFSKSKFLARGRVTFHSPRSSVRGANHGHIMRAQ